MKNDYITIAEYAEIKGISKQAVYKQLNNKLKDFLIEIEGKKFIDKRALSEEEKEKFNNGEQPILNEFQLYLKQQIEEKDGIIENLLRQIDSLQEQNKQLTELLKNSQMLLAAEKKMYLEAETTKRKKGIFGIFKKKEKNT